MATSNSQVKEFKNVYKNDVGSELVFPTKLKDIINENEPIAFVQFSPLAELTVIPQIDDLSNTNENKIKDDAKLIEKTPVSVQLRSITLPIRPVSDSITGEYQSVEGLGKLREGMASYIAWKGYKKLSGLVSSVVPSEIAIAAKTGLLGGGIDNPHDKLLFAGHQRRSQDFQWDFLKPANKEEEAVLRAIVNVFRKSSLGSYGSLVIGPPPKWKVEFYSTPLFAGSKPFLRYKSCGIQNCTVKFGSETDDFKAMESGMPFISLSMTLSELEYPTQDDVEF